MTVRITAFTKYGRRAASTRQRLLQYVPALQRAGFELDYRPLLTDDYVASLAMESHYPASRVIRSYVERITEVAVKPVGDVVWVYAELFPWLPSPFERLLLRRRRPIVYDFDDGFFHSYDDNRSWLRRTLLGGKLEPLLRAAVACTCGNAYLQDYARKFCPNTIIIPTVVDTEVYRPAAGACRQLPVIGWLGSPSTWNYVRPLLPLIKRLCDERRAIFRAVGPGSTGEADRFPGMELVEWTEASEIAELQRMDVGIMPLADEPWARGKSGYKLIQYMACGLPVVASPVGINQELVNDQSGLLACTLIEWERSLRRLLANTDLRKRMGAAGRNRAVAHYSLAVYAPRVVEIFRSAVVKTHPVSLDSHRRR